MLTYYFIEKEKPEKAYIILNRCLKLVYKSSYDSSMQWMNEFYVH